MIKVILPYTFAFMFVAVLVWFLLCVKLFNSLKERHPETYKNMGSPSLFKNNTFSNNINFLKFLFKKEWQQLGDESIEKLGNIMLSFIIAYSALFIVFIYMVLNVNSP